MKTKLRICSLLASVLLAFSLLGLSACGCTAAQDDLSASSSSSAVESSSSAASDQEAQEGSQTAGQDGASAGATSGQQGDVASQPGASGQQGGAGEPASVPSTIRVSVSIQSSNAGDRSFGSISRTVTLEPGASAYDALVATGVSVGGSGSYVTSINGLAEKSCGPSSGWTYYVNGSFPSRPANRTELANGDSVNWLFVTSYDDRL